MNDQDVFSRWRSWAPYLHSVVRIIAAFLFMQPGMAKLLAFPAPILPTGGTVPPGSVLWCAGSLEFVGGGLRLLGLFTRPIAFIVSGEMAVAYFKAHAPH